MTRIKKEQSLGEITIENKLAEFHWLMKVPKFAKMILYRAEQLKILLKEDIAEYSTNFTECSDNNECKDNIIYLDRSSSDLEDLHLREFMEYLKTDPEVKTAVVEDWLYVLKPICLNKMMPGGTSS